MLRASRLAQPGTPMLERDVPVLAPTRKQLTRQARKQRLFAPTFKLDGA